MIGLQKSHEKNQQFILVTHFAAHPQLKQTPYDKQKGRKKKCPYTQRGSHI